MPWATPDVMAKLVPPSTSVAPRGNWLPGRVIGGPVVDGAVHGGLPPDGVAAGELIGAGPGPACRE